MTENTAPPIKTAFAELRAAAEQLRTVDAVAAGLDGMERIQLTAAVTFIRSSLGQAALALSDLWEMGGHHDPA